MGAAEETQPRFFCLAEDFCTMANWIKSAWQRLRGGEQVVNADVVRIASLQEAAKKRRAEYAAAQASTDGGPERLASIRKRVQEAESAYMNAMHLWDDKQFRRKAR
jgi:hypothetical protein